MVLDAAYQIQKVGEKFGRLIDNPDEAIRRFKRRLNHIDGPYRLREEGTWNWGPDRNRTEMLERVESRMRDGRVGTRVIVKGSVPETPQFSIRKTIMLEGPQVVQEARGLLGMRYVFAGIVESGGTDCSGLTMYCYEKVGVVLPHSADAQMHDDDVRLFSERGKLVKGDLLFYNFGRLSYPTADHVGMFIDDNRTIDTRSVSSPVDVREIEWESILHFGRVPQVNGAL